MFRPFVAAILFSAIKYGRAAEICCPDIGCYDDSPPWYLFPLPQCPESMAMNLQLYTRQNPTIGQLITKDFIPSVFDGGRITMFIVPGWLQDQNFTWLHQTKDAVLYRADVNVIIVGWGGGSETLRYPLAASNTRTVGGHIALISNLTIINANSSRERQYCAGHSLGAHVCGQAGRQGNFGRISGIDPAGPLFQGRDWSCGLNPSCADFVDVLHTDGTFMGTLKQLGHIDFYPNGGKLQPGCGAFLLQGLTNLEYLLSNSDGGTWYKLLTVSIGCSHARGYLLFLESIKKSCFISRQVCSNQFFLPAGCRTSANQSMGYSADQDSGRGIFYLKTNDVSPYCQN